MATAAKSEADGKHRERIKSNQFDVIPGNRSLVAVADVIDHKTRSDRLITETTILGVPEKRNTRSNRWLHIGTRWKSLQYKCVTTVNRQFIRKIPRFPAVDPIGPRTSCCYIAVSNSTTEIDTVFSYSFDFQWKKKLHVRFFNFLSVSSFAIPKHKTLSTKASGGLLFQSSMQYPFNLPF